MFEIDETRYYSSRVSFRMFTLENVLDGKKTENSIGRGAWNKNVLGGKISKN